MVDQDPMTLEVMAEDHEIIRMVMADVLLMAIIVDLTGIIDSHDRTINHTTGTGLRNHMMSHMHEELYHHTMQHFLLDRHHQMLITMAIGMTDHRIVMTIGVSHLEHVSPVVVGHQTTNDRTNLLQ